MRAVGYGAQSAQVYRDTLISVNATNLQMPSTVNQRLFDVPAAGGFLISDNQPEMAELFIQERAAFPHHHRPLYFVTKGEEEECKHHAFFERLVRWAAEDERG